MSEITRSLLAQEAAGQEPDVGEAFKKIFGNIPVIDRQTERERFIKTRNELLEKVRAESQKR